MKHINLKNQFGTYIFKRVKPGERLLSNYRFGDLKVITIPVWMWSINQSAQNLVWSISVRCKNIWIENQ